MDYIQAHQSPEGRGHTHQFSERANVGLTQRKVPAVSHVDPVGQPSYQEVHVAQGRWMPTEATLTPRLLLLTTPNKVTPIEYVLTSLGHHTPGTQLTCPRHQMAASSTITWP